MASCRDDPLVCIEFLILGIGEFLKEWTTLGMLALLLILLLKLRADREEAHRQAHAARMASYEARRAAQAAPPERTWVIKTKDD